MGWLYVYLHKQGATKDDVDVDMAKFATAIGERKMEELGMHPGDAVSGPIFVSSDETTFAQLVERRSNQSKISIGEELDGSGSFYSATLDGRQVACKQYAVTYSSSEDDKLFQQICVNSKGGGNDGGHGYCSSQKCIAQTVRFC